MPPDRGRRGAVGEPGDGAAPRSRYPDYDVLDRWDGPDWDGPTRAVVRRRLAEVPPIRFLTPDEARLLQAVADRIVPQLERPPGARVPIVPWIDEKLWHDWRDGYRYADLPPQRDAWRAGLAALAETARLLHALDFAALDEAAQDDLLARVQRGDVPGAAWSHIPARRFFRDVLCITVVKTYFAHPAAWSEIGYGGPSSPRGHVRNWMGGVDPWEPAEQTGEGSS
ncbi:MAG TPA: gluconate 2-dehydrogenase subunit 3 family protein [Gemmatimonadales bacterium]